MNPFQKLLSLLVVLPIGLYGQSVDSSAKGGVDSVKNSKQLVKVDNFIATIDSALNQWQATFQSLENDGFSQIDSNASRKSLPRFSDSFYQHEMKKLVETSPIDFTYNKWVKPFIDLYARQKHGHVQQLMGLSDYYFPIFETHLDREGLPLRLKYLPVIESALNPNAVSPAGASGIWQFMYPTARQYGLNVTTYVDERRNTVASTKAAVHYLSDLYKIYEDWLMVIAAYNCGPGNVNKAVRRSGYSDNFWKIYPFLPRETRGYVPAFIAVAHVFENAEAHKLSPKKPELPTVTDTVMVNKKLHLKTVAKGMDLDIESLRALNPEFKRDVIPGGDKPNSLLLPLKSALAFCSQSDSLYALQDSLFKEEGEDETLANSEDSDPAYETLYYTVKKGDNLGYIAEWYDCSAGEIRRWNRLRGSRIHVGDRMKIRVPSAKANDYKKINRLSFAQKQQLTRKGSVQGGKIQGDDFIYYQVQHGDTLWNIARKFNGVSIGNLRKLNDLTKHQHINPGDKIKVKQKG